HDDDQIIRKETPQGRGVSLQMGGVPFRLQTRERDTGVGHLRLKSHERQQHGGDPHHAVTFGRHNLLRLQVAARWSGFHSTTIFAAHRAVAAVTARIMKGTSRTAVWCPERDVASRRSTYAPGARSFPGISA